MLKLLKIFNKPQANLLIMNLKKFGLIISHQLLTNLKSALNMHNKPSKKGKLSIVWGEGNGTNAGKFSLKN